MQNLEAHRQTLHAISASLAAERVIDRLQEFDMNEMANAAYWHAIEELQDAPPHYCGASTYDIVQCGGIELYGHISRSIFYSAGTNSAKTSYDGKIYCDATGANLVFTPSGAFARITGLTLTLPEGQQYDLIESGRTVDGVTFTPIDNPDFYRALVDTAQVAHECHDIPAFEKIRPLIDLARFQICPACRDRFDLREDCTTCSSHGFVTKAPAIGLP
jgi:hypothetical protein